MRRVISFVVTGIGVVIFLFYVAIKPIFNKVGGERYVPYQELRKSRFHAEANKLADREGQTIEDSLGNNPDGTTLRRKSRELNAVGIELDRNNSEVDTPPAKGCPDQLTRDQKGIYFNTSGCEGQDAFAYPALLDPWDEQVYSVRLYSHSDHLPVYEVPDIQKCNNNTHNVAEKISDPYPIRENGKIVAIATDYKLRGDVRFFPHGKDYAVEWILK